MNRSIALLAGWLAWGSAEASYLLDCTSGCVAAPAEERTPNLLLIEPDVTEIELTWTSTAAPDPEVALELRAGNPLRKDHLDSLGPLQLTESAGEWRAQRRFRVADLGHGTFIAVVLEKRGSRTTIADWHTLRVLTLAELQESLREREMPGGLSVDVAPELLQVTSGRGELPGFTGGDERVWWTIPASTNGVDVDIDGTHNGVPGITITRSPPWASRGNDWQRQLVEELRAALPGHFVDFGELSFHEAPDRTIDLGGQSGTVLLKHFYSAVTLFTNASTAVYRAQDLGLRGNRRYFAHETTANFRQLAHPKLWASYSRHEYSADPELLELVQRAVQGGSGVPGLNLVQQEDGDGGSVIYRVGLRARVAPWSLPETETGAWRPGFVHVDVVAVRSGFGDVQTHRDMNDKGLCKLIPCKDDTKIDLSKPPRGYAVYAPVAITGSQSGTLAMMQGTPLRAQREGPVEGIDFPETTRFALAAQLRAGAFVRKSGVLGRSIEDLVPINSYAQYVLKYTVAMVPQTVMVASDEVLLPKASEFDTSTVVVPVKSLWQRLIAAIGWPGMIVLGVIVLGLLAFFVPGVARLFNSILRFFATLVDRGTASLRRGN